MSYDTYDPTRLDFRHHPVDGYERKCIAELGAALRESQAREAVVTAALRRLLDEIQIEMEGKGGSKRQTLARLDVAALNARAALASPSDAAAKLLERVADWGKLTRLNEEWQGVEAALVADRDRWLGHCRELVATLATASIGDHPPSRGALSAARRDLEQHDKENK